MRQSENEKKSVTHVPGMKCYLCTRIIPPGFFAEVLYLKLAFLLEVIRLVPDEEAFVRPGARLSLDKFWVRLPGQSSLLPSLWTFSVHPADIYWSFSKTRPLSKLISRPNPYFLAPIWFSVLLVNKNQTLEDLCQAIEESLDNTHAADSLSGQLQRQAFSHQAFLPANIFWDQPGDKALILKTPQLAFWEQALALGRSLLEAAGENKNDWSKTSFLQDVGRLSEEVHDSLFAAVPSTMNPAPPPEPDHRIIGDILAEILSKWRREMPEELVMAEATPPGPQKTMQAESRGLTPVELIANLFSSHDEQKSEVGQPLADETLPYKVAARTPSIDTNGESVETIILGPPDMNEKVLASTGTDIETILILIARAKAKAKIIEDDDLEKTVILSLGGEIKYPPSQSQATVPDEEDPEKTLIISPSNNRKPEAY